MRQLSVTNVGAATDTSFRKHVHLVRVVLGVHATCSSRLQARGAVLKMENGGACSAHLTSPLKTRVWGCAQRTGLPGDILLDRSPCFLEGQIPGIREAGLCVSCLGKGRLGVLARRGELPNTVQLGWLIQTVAASVSKCSVAGGRTGRWGHLCTCENGTGVAWPHLPWHYSGAA